MRKLHRRLHRYEQNMDDYVKSREVLEAKMQIHKKMGQALLLSRAFLLQNDGKITSSEVLNKWKYVTMFLKKEIQMPEEPDEWGRLVNSATAAGVKIKVEGKLPIGSGQDGASCTGCCGGADKCSASCRCRYTKCPPALSSG